MGEYINASVRLGGKLPAEHVDELLELINERGLGPDWDQVGEVTFEDLQRTNFFGDSQVNYGNLDEILSFAHEHGLYYHYECGSGPEWDAQTIFYNPTTEESREFVGENELAITLQQVKKLGSFDKVVAYFDTDVPELEIVGEYRSLTAPVEEPSPSPEPSDA